MKLFLVYINEKGIISKEELPLLLKFFSELDRRVGHLCALKGYLAYKDVIYILSKQSAENALFGAVAVRENLISETQLNEVIALQKNPFDLFLESLSTLRLVEESKLEGILEGFKAFAKEKDTSTVLKSPAAEAFAPSIKEHRHTLGREDVYAILRKINGLGTLPTVIQRVLALTADPDTKIDILSDTIKSDPTLSADLLRLVNSAHSGAKRRFALISDAVGRLGLVGV